MLNFINNPSTTDKTSKEREELFKVHIPIFWGGPVDPKEIFVLHSNEYKSESTIKYENISISQDYEILFDIAKNKGPKKSLIILGYSGWGKGQLEGEIERDHWILSDIDLDITFDEESKKCLMKHMFLLIRKEIYQ